MDEGVKKLSYALGIIIFIFLILVLNLPSADIFHSPGPYNPGHESLKCNDCHNPAPGSFRQQLQSNTKKWLGMRNTSSYVGFEPVQNEDCNKCHARENDMHPSFRFEESRFSKEKIGIAPQLCTSCHLEHKDKRVSLEPNLCMHCHENLELKKDPLDVSHSELIKTNEWNSCMGCHDFHGNHNWKAPIKLNESISIEEIIEYLDNGPSPYGPVVVKAKK